MIKSMTGFGKGTYEIEDRVYQVEIKSVNHKYNDITIKTPRMLSYLEEKIKQELLQHISRGKIDVFVTFINYSNKGKKIRINQDLALTYIQQLKELSNKANLIGNINIMDIAKLPEVLTIENTEGEKIAQDINKRNTIIAEKIEKISEFSTGLVEEYVVKLKERIKEILKTNVVDENRLAQEIVIYSDKCSIEEELTRLRSHIKELKNLISSNIPIGKNMDFLVQEMNREINTIASKANCLEITKLVIEVKTIIEDIREQIQNIE